MKPDEMHRRDLIKTVALGSTSLLPLFPLAVSSQPAALAASYTAKFFSPQELELVGTLAELIIPQTDTPGARAARVHEYIDKVLGEETPEVQHDFREGLTWLDRRSSQLHGRGFLALSPENQTDVLTRISRRQTGSEEERGHRFFLDLRSRVVFGYYTSEIGLDQELTYKGTQVLGHWEGCPHPDHHGDAE